MITRYATTLALVCGLTWPAYADSPLTSVETNSKTAARVGASPYAGHVASPDQAKKTVAKGLQVIKQTKGNAAIGLGVIQRVDGADMDNPGTTAALKRGLIKLQRQTKDPAEKARYGLLRGTATIMRDTNNKYAARQVNKAARTLPRASDVQLVAGVVSAQRAAFGKTSNWDKPTPLWKQSAQRINKAQRIEATTDHPRPLVRHGVSSAKDYLGGYGGFSAAQKHVTR